MSAHTPGPWHLSGFDDGPGAYHMHVGAETSPMVLASINPVHCDSRANARLFAAAPDLFEAAKQMVQSSASQDPQDWADALEKLEAAIAKAEVSP